jgi:hypothetical protein
VVKLVLIRYGNEKIKRFFGKMLYREDTVWSMRRESYLRAKHLDAAGLYPKITGEKVFTVWSSISHRKGTRIGKANEKRLKRH